jgi:sulfite reductase (ferredoxin)
VLLNDFAANVADGENFHAYYDRQTKDYFYQLLKPLADLTNLKDEEFVDWGHEETFVTAIGVGECAGVVIDLVATLLLESEEKLSWAKASYEAGAWSDAIYHTYAVYVSAAKALLLDKGVNSSTQIGIIREFDNHYVQTGEIQLESSFADLVLEINKHEPSEEFATAYLASLEEFYNGIKAARAEKVS